MKFFSDMSLVSYELLNNMKQILQIIIYENNK